MSLVGCGVASLDAARPGTDVGRSACWALTLRLGSPRPQISWRSRRQCILSWSRPGPSDASTACHAWGPRYLHEGRRGLWRPIARHLAGAPETSGYVSASTVFCATAAAGRRAARLQGLSGVRQQLGPGGARARASAPPSHIPLRVMAGTGRIFAWRCRKSSRGEAWR